MPMEKWIKLTWILAAIPYFIALIFGIIYAAAGKLLFYHEAFAGMTSEEIAALHPNLMTLIGLIIRVMGCLFICIGLVGLFVIYLGYRKEQRMAWPIIFFTSFLLIIPLVVETYIVAGWGFPFPIVLICLICWICAIGLNMMIQAEQGDKAAAAT